MRRALVITTLVALAACASAQSRLMDAARKGDQAAIAEALKAEGVKVDGVVGHVNALEVAVRANNLAAARALLDAGANVNGLPNRRAPLLIALHDERWEMATLLLERGADARRDGNALGQLISMDAQCRERGRDLVAAKQVAAMASRLLKAGADPNAPNEWNETPLRGAIKCWNAPLARTLIQAGARVDATTHDGETPLMHAWKQQAAEVIGVLLEAGADTKAKDRRGKTAADHAFASVRPPARNLALEALAASGDPDALARVEAYRSAERLHKKTRDAVAGQNARAANEMRAAEKAAEEARKNAPPPPPSDLIDRDTSSYDRARACPYGGVYCGNSCCGNGMMCCVPDGVSDRSGGVCIAIRTGHGCPWGSHKEGY